MIALLIVNDPYMYLLSCKKGILYYKLLVFFILVRTYYIHRSEYYNSDLPYMIEFIIVVLFT